MTFQTEVETLEWYAIHVKSNRERITAQALTGKGFEPFLPVCNQPDCLADGRQTNSLRPSKLLFAGYIFCRFDATQRLPILTTPGVVRIVGNGRMPLPVDPVEMANIHALTQAHLELEPHPYPPVGEKIRVDRGPLSGVEGVILAHKGKGQLVVSVTLLQRAVAVDMERDWVTAAQPAYRISGAGTYE